jgi:hypothetical protein
MKIRMSMTTSTINSLLPGEGLIPNAVRIGKIASMYRRKHTCIWLSVHADVRSQPDQHRKPDLTSPCQPVPGGTYTLH